MSQKRNIVKDSTVVRSAIMGRMNELGISISDIIKDALDKGRKIDMSALSRYLKHGNVKGSLSEEDIIWIAIRWGIDVQLVVGKIKIVEGKASVSLAPYNEESAVNKLKIIFG